MASQNRVHYRSQDNIALIRLDDGKANAVCHELIGEVGEALDQSESDASAVVITGRPGRFSAGFDLATMTAGPQQARELVAAGCGLLMRIYMHPQPVVVACTGHALAAGALMLLVADRRVGVDGDFKIGLNEVAIGLRLPVFAVELARERLSKRHFTAATSLARIYSPSEARDAGFLDEVVAPEQLEEAALAEAAGLAALPGKAFAQTKELARGSLAAKIRETLEDDMDRLAPPSNVRRP